MKTREGKGKERGRDGQLERQIKRARERENVKGNRDSGVGRERE